MTEKWKPVAGFEGFYAVSNRGRIESLGRIVHDQRGTARRLPKRMMSGAVGVRQYLRVFLRKLGKKQVRRPVHSVAARNELVEKCWRDA
jgi:hypothetical protein